MAKARANTRAVPEKHVRGSEGPPAGQRAEAELRLPSGEPDLEGLQAVTREWLVPRLVEKFLRVHGIELKHSRQHAERLRLSLSDRFPLAGDEAVPRTSIGKTGDLSKKLDRKRMRKRNIEH
jgi:hypothetical protein